MKYIKVRGYWYTEDDYREVNDWLLREDQVVHLSRNNAGVLFLYLVTEPGDRGICVADATEADRLWSLFDREVLG